MILEAVLLSLLAGGSIFVGALLASCENLRPRWLEQELRHTIIAFGGGALLAAVALVLVPDGMNKQPAWLALTSFFAGGVLFMLVDYVLARKQWRISQLMAMLLDFMPEAMVIGAIIGEQYEMAVFMAVIIAAQNLPESFNAYREIHARNHLSTRKLLLAFAAISLTGPLYVLVGTFALASHPMLLGTLMTFCAGGILYLIFEDVAPNVPLQQSWAPPLGAVIGFMVGMAGHAIIG
ncbi:MAG: divalent cation transporter [Rickettsiales bacterium]|nr:divalent cation transporter [Rickettsiales bacterium]